MPELKWVNDPDDDAWDELAALFTLRCREGIPTERPTSGEEWRAGARNVSPHVQNFQVLAMEDGVSVGGAAFGMRRHRAESAWMLFLFVRAEHRRRGLGSFMLGAIRDVVKSHGRTRIWTQTYAGDADANRFAARHGGQRGLVVDQTRCPTASLNPEQLRTWCDRVSERAAGYSLVTFDDVCPDEYLDRFVAAIPIMNTAPRADEAEDFMPSREEVRESMATAVAGGTRIWTACTRDDRTGEFVGYTQLFFPRHRPWLAAQGDTGIHPDHRNRGLGRWLKAHNGLRLLAERPDVEFIETWNAASNTAMLSINQDMGFRVVARRQEWNVPV